MYLHKIKIKKFDITMVEDQKTWNQASQREEVTSEKAQQPNYRRFIDNDSNIFDDICKLQTLIQMETEIKQTFFIRFDEMIQTTLR